MESQSAAPAARRYLTPEQAIEEARAAGAPIGRSGFYEALRRGQVPHARVGKRYLIPADFLERLLAEPKAPVADVA